MNDFTKTLLHPEHVGIIASHGDRTLLPIYSLIDWLRAKGYNDDFKVSGSVDFPVAYFPDEIALLYTMTFAPYSAKHLIKLAY
ncbi:hypothetical protein [Sphingomonas sp. GB1N7]|uniref:hypothetical protein n=1 Tax=Parasphingomonas caseinilytica TaxID=3096158 RepID=UPI002FC7DA1E